MTLYTFAIAPFVEFGFMRRALVACLALAVSCGPVGTLLVLRRMSLVGDAMAHALLPGAAVGFVLAGFSLAAMSAGAFLLGLTVALLAGVVTRTTMQKEDASFAAFYLIALAGGSCSSPRTAAASTSCTCCSDRSWPLTTRPCSR